MTGWFAKSLIVASLTLVSSHGAASADSPLRFYTEEYAPFSFSGDERVEGINTELLGKALASLSLRAEFLVVPWGRAQLLTQSQSNACFFSAARTPEREEMYQWAGPLSREKITFFTIDPEAPTLPSISDAVNLKVGGQIADAYSAWVENQGVAVERVTEVADNLLKLEWGRIDLWLAGSVAGPYIAAQKDMTIYPVAASEESFDLWLACSPEMPTSMVEALDSAIHTLREDGTLDSIMSSYH